MEKIYDIVGLGNPIMDLLVNIDEETLSSLNLKKGESNLVEEERAKQLLKKIRQQNLAMESAPGGSCSNTLRGVALLGGKALLYGKVGEDEHGRNYVAETEKQGVQSKIKTHPSTTAHALTLITPDTERTFSVHLGAALTLAKEDLQEEDIKNSKILHLEAYQLEGPTREVALHALEVAKQNGTLISLDLSDPGLIKRNKKFLREIVQKYVDILFFNETEGKEFTGWEEEEALEEVAKEVKIAILKLGERGSLIAHEKKMIKIDPLPAQAIDTTGAGDTYAAGFLYGYAQGWPLAKAAKLGASMAARIVEIKGTKIQQLNLAEIKKEVENYFSTP